MFDQENFSRLAKWVGFVGMMSLITGVVQMLSIVGILPGVLFIILGFKLLGAKSSAKAIASFSGEELPPEQLNKMVNDLRLYFQINGILLISGLVFAALMVVAGIIGYYTIPWEDFFGSFNS